MRNITISQGVSSVTLAADLDFDAYYKPVEKKSVMASGRIVKDVKGNRKCIDIPVGYLPLADVRKLKAMINSGNPLSVAYPGIDGDESGQFYSSQPKYRARKYGPDGVTMWVGMELQLQAVKPEVEK